MWSNYPQIEEELTLVENYVKQHIHSKNAVLTDLLLSLVNAGGKRLRPAFVILSSKLGKYNRKKVIPAASALEVLHLATLVHDDIIDTAKTRRGQATIHMKKDIPTGIYSGDFLFTKSVLMFANVLPPKRLEMIARGIKSILEGEVYQHYGKYNVNMSTLSYLKNIARKTALLFVSACGIGAHLGQLSDSHTKLLIRFAFNYGMAFQICDDINDYLSSDAKSGKPVGNDLASGIITLPAIFSMANAPLVKTKITALFDQRLSIPGEPLQEALALVIENDGIALTKVVLEKYIQRALANLDLLPNSPYISIFRELVLNLKSE